MLKDEANVVAFTSGNVEGFLDEEMHCLNIRGRKEDKERAACANYEVCAEDVAMEQGRLSWQAKVSGDGFFPFPITFNNMKKVLDALEASMQGSEWMYKKLGSMTLAAKEQINRTHIKRPLYQPLGNMTNKTAKYQEPKRSWQKNMQFQC